jgi:ATP-dependent DNA helicase UvrD/PcrA
MQSLREQINTNFATELNRLNPSQQKAVDKIEGPVMVIAGPGTGKTQILAARIGKILLETDVLPENILCLTYTDAGAVAMRRRLLSFIGTDAYKVAISTFHAFCNDIIQDNLSLFEKNVLDPVSDLERIQFMKEIIDNFPAGHPLKRYRGDVYYEIKPLSDLFAAMKREGWMPEFIGKKIDSYIRDLPQREEYICKKATKEYKKGDIRRDKIEAEKDKMERLRAAVNEFSQYQQIMESHKRYDFDDMINWVIKAFGEQPQMMAAYQEKYQYVLVDEYQDTSGTQNDLVYRLISFWDTPNIFVVGDDDQSIFRFQGANVENMLHFVHRYQKDLLTVILTDNYRSSQPILDTARLLIENNRERLVNQVEGLSKDLKAANDEVIGLHEPPVIKEYESVFHEMCAISNNVEQLLQEGIPAGNIGIIFKENKYGRELADFFRVKNIPYYSRKSVNILEEPFVRKIITILQYLAAELDTPGSGDELLFEILHFDFYHIPANNIARMSVEVAEKNYTQKTSLRSFIRDKKITRQGSLFMASADKGIFAVSDLLEKWLSDALNYTLQQLFGIIISEGRILAYIESRAEKSWHLQLLHSFFDFIKSETGRNPLLDIRELMMNIELMQKNNISIELIQVTGSEKGVNLLTVHGAKGLEFEYVFMMGCNASLWEKKRKNFGEFSFPDTMFETQNLKDADREELRRLFYVAITRAKKYLCMSYARFRNDGKDLEPSIFLEEIKLLPVPLEKVVLNEAMINDFIALQFVESSPVHLQNIEIDFIDRLLENFVMNVTALNNYLKCPLQFYYQNLIRVPAGKSESTEFGSAVHFALQRLFEKMQQHPKKEFPKVEEMMDDFRWYMLRHRENFTREGFARRMEYAKEILPAYYKHSVGSWNKVVSVERNIRNVLMDGIPLKGKLDKLEFDGSLANVVDYKTGDLEKAKEKLKAPDDKRPLGGDYWRQAVFYKILVDAYVSRDWKVVSTEFDFIEPDKKQQYHREKINITPADITTVKQQIKDTWQQIQQREFYTGCGKEDCHWCNFVKTYELDVIAISDEEE